MNQAEVRPAVCEIPLRSGKPCGVTAKVRCMTCERALCESHQATTTRLVDEVGPDGRLLPFPRTVHLQMCEACFATSPAELARIESEKRAAQIRQEQEEAKRQSLLQIHGPRIEAEEYFVSGAARQALIAAGIPKGVVYKTETIQKKGLFGSRWVETIVSTQHGWRIGNLLWTYDAGGDVSLQSTFLTIMLDQDISNALSNYTTTERATHLRVFVRVEPYADGYKDIGGGHLADWIAAAKAVKQLCGTGI